MCTNNETDNNNLSLIVFEHPEWGDLIFRDQNGRIKNPLEPNIYVFIFNCLCCFISLPANLCVAILMLKRHLVSKARHIILLHLVLSSLFTSFNDIIAIIYYIWPMESLCCIYESTIGLSYVAFCFNLLLSLIDHCVAITNPLWHRRNVTLRPTIIWPFVLNFILALSVKWMFISGTALQMCCAIQVVHFEALVVTWLVLCLSCLIFLVIVYVKTWQVLPRPSRTVNVQVETILIDVPSNTKSKLERTNTGMSVHMGNDAITRMELEATKTFLIGAIPLLLLPLPGLIYSFSTLICLYQGTAQNCDTMTSLVAYFEKLMSLHAVVHPITNLLINKDLASRAANQQRNNSGSARRDRYPCEE